MMHVARPLDWPIPAAVIALICLTWAVFFPILSFDFVDMDMDDHVVRNKHVHGLSRENVKFIFSSRCYTSYYPLRSLTYAVDYQIWGLNPRGFKLTNGLIHQANVLLVFWLVLRLCRRASDKERPRGWWDAYVAAFCAGIFAVHPVVVEPVTWTPGREELLMTLGALSCLHFHLWARRIQAEGGSRRKAIACRVGATLSCAAACMGNAVGAVLPMIVTAWDLLTLETPKFRKIVGATAALWVIGVATVVIKKTGPSAELLSDQAAFLSIERLTLALNVYLLNLKSLVWPTNLAISYELSLPEGSRIPGAFLGAVAVILTGVGLWSLRRRKLIFFGLLWFGLALGPSSQIMPHHIHRADRLLYLPLVGLVIAAALGLKRLQTALRRPAVLTGAVAVCSLGLSWLGVLAACHVQTWRNSLSVWENCAAVQPRNHFAHRSLADNYVKRGRFDLAIPHFEESLRLRPDGIEALNNYALELATIPDEAMRDYDLAIDLARRGCEIGLGKVPKLLRTLAMGYNNRALKREKDGRFDRAVQDYYKAMETDSEYAGAYFNLALLRASCDDETLRRGEEAVWLAESACRMVEDPEPNALMILAAAYAEAKRFEMAVATTERAIEGARNAGHMELADQLQGRLEFYQDRAADEQLP